ncbi:hypothetical protein XENTR_v10005288 [Xenopus tropicalis]|nr:hypothetical protein XENTR_v10005288 [Xenopus tropicalis]
MINPALQRQFHSYLTALPQHWLLQLQLVCFNKPQQLRLHFLLSPLLGKRCALNMDYSERKKALEKCIKTKYN